MIGIRPIPDPHGEFGAEICAVCGCRWRGEDAHAKDENCTEPTPFIGFRSCFCHSQDFWDGYNREMDRMDIKRETVIAYLDHVDADVQEAG